MTTFAKEKGNGMEPKLRSEIVPLLRRRIDADEYRTIRQLWVAHSLAEDAHDIPGLMVTLTEDCVYTVVNKGVDWHGKAGATQFYQQLLTAFPDIHFDLQNIVIGPQGVFEEAFVTGTCEARWLDLAPPTGQRVEFFVTILFPWDPQQKLFTGERIYFFLK
jgi:predicted ester cyclase